METIIISKKKNIKLSEEIRTFLNIKPGTKLEVIENDGSIKLIPSLDIHHLFELYPNIYTNIDREDDRI